MIRIVMISILFAAAAVVQSCAPAPYLYISLHGSKSSNTAETIAKYSRDGCVFPAPLIGGSVATPRDFQFVTPDVLLVTDATTEASHVAAFGSCDASGVRKFLDDYLPVGTPGMVHPYGLSFDTITGVVYVSSQDTNVVQYFEGPLSPMSGHPLPNSAQVNQTGGSPYPGTFYELLQTSNGVRDVIYGANTIFIASEDDDVIIAADPVTGHERGRVPLSNGVGLFFDQDSNTVYAGGRKNSVGVVIAFDATSLVVKQSFTDSALTHPAGIALYDGILYVIEQNNNIVMMFDIDSAKLLSQWKPTSTDAMEQVHLSAC